jgi:hypothetical protein
MNLGRAFLLFPYCVANNFCGRTQRWFHARRPALSIPTFFHCSHFWRKQFVPSRSFDRCQRPLLGGLRRRRGAHLLPTIFTVPQTCRKHSSRQLSQPSPQNESVEVRRGAQRYTQHFPFQLFSLIPKSVANIRVNLIFRSLRGPTLR